jgi:hypothetical protein
MEKKPQIKKETKFSVLNLTQQDIPIITEDTKTRYSWVPVGIMDQDDFFPIITDSFSTSTTHAACVEGISDLIFGKGMYSKNDMFDAVLMKLIDQEDIKKIAFDLKLYGNFAAQVWWNDDHSKVKKIYHIPVQNVRAEKIYDKPKVENYYYCTDWSDMREQRNKKTIPAFGTSNEKMEIYYGKNYTPGKFYYSLPDWISALQFSFAEAELSNLHINNIENGFMPLVMINFNNGVPAPEERQTIESGVVNKFTGTRNAGRFMISFNDDPNAKPTIDTIQTENLHEKYQYVAEYAQDRILVAHRVTSPLLFGIRTANNGFSSQSEEMKTAFSIMQTMTVQPHQNTIINCFSNIFRLGGWGIDLELYFEQLTPLAILSTTAEETGQTIDEVEETIDESMENTQQMEDEIELNEE